MASSSTTSGRTEREPANISQEVAPSSSSFSPSRLFSCCYDWVSVFLSRRSGESNSMASTSSTTGCIPENEVMTAFNEVEPSASTSGTTSCIRENEGMGAFHEIAPSASTSGASSTPIQKPCYDVFINHRGPDVKETLASRIYNFLVDMKVTAFLDSEELECGDFLPTTLEAVIRGAIIHIAIFSKRYAESPWCLAELSCMLKSGAKIVPIFYDVDPIDLRYVAKRKGMYVDAFENHEKKRRYSAAKLQEWKDALYEVSFYSGIIIKNNYDEMGLLKNIGNIVQKERSNVPLVVAKHPVGLSEAVKDFENTFQLDHGEQDVQIVGIWGMGGLGKTTLAKEIYNKRRSSMEKSCFIFDIKEAKSVLQNKQNQLLKGLGVNDTVDNIEQGKATLARYLGSFKMLIVMDDVDHADQLDALIPFKERLGRGSLLIVTTREFEVLTSWDISSVYKLKALDPHNAEQLFCWHAFLQPSPLDGFEVLVKKFLEACHGLPLSLKVVGAQLHRNFLKKDWESLLHKISRILPEDIKEILKVSYDALDDEEKEAFLDIACFFIGEENSLVIEVWDGSGWSGLHTWKKLLNKCLVELDDHNYIKMHDYLRDIGREIASQHCPSRLWSTQQIIQYGNRTKIRNGIRGIKATAIRREERWPFTEEREPNISGETLLLAPYLVGLKLLVIRGDYLNQVIGEVSRELLWLRWFSIKQRNLPTQLSLKNLRVLELYEYEWLENHLEELWETESDAPVHLRELVISRCCKFQRFPNSIGCLNELRKIVIKGASNVCSLPAEICRLRLLENLVLDECGISSLPSSFGELTNLQYLSLQGCSNLRILPDTFKNLTRLQHLNLRGCGQLILMSDDFQNITELEFLMLSDCGRLEELPRHITNQVSLEELYLPGMGSLRELPVEIGELRRLRKVEIGSLMLSLTECCSSLKSLPNSIGNLSSLTDLSILFCPTLESLPTSLGDLFSLTNLSIENCPKLKCLPSSVERLSLLEYLRIFACPISQLDFGVTSSSFTFSNLKWMEIQKTEVCSISISEDRYPRLERLKLKHNNHLKEIEALPVNLEWFHLKSCPQLDMLPSFTRLSSLREFKVRDCDRIEKIEGLKYCTRLEILTLHTSWEVPSIESFEHMKRLRTVELKANKGSAIRSFIQTIQKWPDEIIICTRAISDASSHVDSLLSPNLSVIDSFSNQLLSSCPELLRNHFSNSNAIMLCYVINCVHSLQMETNLERSEDRYSGGMNVMRSSMGIDDGRWALIAVFTKSSRWLATGDLSRHAFFIAHDFQDWESRVERGLALRGEEQRLQGLAVEAFCHLTC